MQNQPNDAFPSDTRKNPKDCMEENLIGGRELEERRNEKKETEEEKHTRIGEELKQQSSEVAKEDRKEKM